MNKLALLLTAMGIAGIATVKLTGDPFEISVFNWAAEQKQQEAIANYQSFKQTLDDCLNALAEGRMSLSEAQYRVQSAARCYRPDYLDWLTHAEDGTTNSERVARNLVGHLRASCDAKPHLLMRVEELELEVECISWPNDSI
jgi:hypothetical protein